MAKGRVCSKQNTHEIIQNETLSFKKIIVSGLGGRAECHLQCTANIRVVAAIRNLPGRLPREPSSRPLISSAMDGRGVHISDDKEQNLLARSVRSALSREQPECVRGASPPANLRHARQRPTANPRLNPGVPPTPNFANPLPTSRSLFFANPTPAPRPEILQASDRGLPVDEGPW